MATRFCGCLSHSSFQAVRPCNPCTPCVVQSVYRFCFFKLDQFSGGGILGAVFQLRGACGTCLRQATSSATGEVCFDNLQPGCYQLQEIVAPPGYQLNATLHQVDICANGTVLFDNSSQMPFVLQNEPLISEAPSINPVSAGATEVRGTGNAGCMVTVTFPSGAMLAVTVQQNGIWSAMVPSGVTLQAGDAVSAFQTCAPAAPSNTVTRLVDSVTEGRTVAGLVTPVAFDDHGFGSAFLNLFNVVVELRTNLNTPAPAALRTVAIPIGATNQGLFSIPNVPFGTYILYITRAGYLTRTMLITVSAASSNPLVLAPPSGGNVFNLYAGDSNDNMVVDAPDVDILNTAYLALYPQARYTPVADFDASGEVNSLDRSLQITNYTRASSEYPGAYIL